MVDLCTFTSHKWLIKHRDNFTFYFFLYTWWLRPERVKWTRTLPHHWKIQRTSATAVKLYSLKHTHLTIMPCGGLRYRNMSLIDGFISFLLFSTGCWQLAPSVHDDRHLRQKLEVSTCSGEKRRNRKLRSICKIWGFHSGDYEECRLLGCGAVYILCEPTFRRNVMPPFSG
jgi:hypothetical protein